MEKEMVNHPEHYRKDTGFEAIDVIEAWDLNFSLGSAVKYIARCGHKFDDIEDLEKAAWYVNREIDRRKNIAIKTEKSINVAEMRAKRQKLLENKNN